MATRPDSYVTWATDGGADVTEPSTGKKGTGNVDDEVIDTGEHNWRRRENGKWQQYLDERLDVSGPNNSSRLHGLEYSSTGLTLNLSPGAIVIDGDRIEITATDLSTSGDGSHTFTNDTDTYVAVNASKAFEYNEVAVDAAVPTPTAGYVHFEMVRTESSLAVAQSVNGRLAGTLARGHVVTRSLAVEGETGRAPILGVHNPVAGSAVIELGTNALMRSRLVADATSIVLESWDAGAKTADAMTIDNATGDADFAGCVHAKHVTLDEYAGGTTSSTLEIDPADGGTQVFTLGDATAISLAATTYNYDIDVVFVQGTGGGHDPTVSGVTLPAGESLSFAQGEGEQTVVRFFKRNGTVFAKSTDYGLKPASMSQASYRIGSGDLNLLGAIADGSLIIAVTASGDSAPPSNPTPSGFTQATTRTYSDSSGDDYVVTIWYKVASSETGTYSFSADFAYVGVVDFDFGGTPTVQELGGVTSTNEATSMTTTGCSTISGVPHVGISVMIADDQILTGHAVDNGYEILLSVNDIDSPYLINCSIAIATFATAVDPDMTWSWNSDTADAAAIVATFNDGS